MCAKTQLMPLQQIITSEERDLISHPVVLKALTQKWDAYAKTVVLTGQLVDFVHAFLGIYFCLFVAVSVSGPRWVSPSRQQTLTPVFCVCDRHADALGAACVLDARHCRLGREPRDGVRAVLAVGIERDRARRVPAHGVPVAVLCDRGLAALSRGDWGRAARRERGQDHRESERDRDRDRERQRQTDSCTQTHLM